MSFESVSERLTALQNTNAQLKELIERLATLKFQPGSVPLDNDDDNVMAELTADIHQTLKEQEEDFEVLQEDVLDLNPGRAGSELELQKEGLDSAVKRAIKELKTCQSAFRRALLTARRTLQQAQREERRLLLLSYTTEASPSDSAPTQGQRRANKTPDPLSQDKEVAASSDVTAALRRTHDMMASELSRSQFAHDTLKESTAALAQLGESYSTLDTLLSSSKNLLGTLLRSQKSDTWYLETAFYVLVATIGWLLWRRLLYGPTWWLVWFPMKIFFRSLTGVLTGVGLIGGSASVSSLTTATSSTIATTVTTSPTTTWGKLSAPLGATGPPMVHVGGGGRGAPMHRPSSPPNPNRVYSEQVEKVIDDSKKETEAKEGQGEEGDAGPSTEEEPRNPKKRMWEEEVPPPQEPEPEPAPEPSAEEEPRNPKKRMWEEDKETEKEATRNKDEL
ncbi:hypothetical protein HYALB_00008022 [Hymenoscyphus albidus]|uniref:Sec20 C-terminal domain-containing protein n=1 Tax=Hymenoscyphus albidus TaxID=595503 RepID=A0A9N9LD99_9HELO|nr:hypothetical protein HYALB_00008022 [Hymenoscyphus albidus]